MNMDLVRAQINILVENLYKTTLSYIKDTYI